MLDIYMFRENDALIRADHDKRGLPHDKIDEVIQFDQQWLNLQHQTNQLRQKKNTAAKGISEAKKSDKHNMLGEQIKLLKERGYKFHPYNRKKCLKLGKLNFTHGKYTTKYHSQKHLEHYGESIMYGHTHDLQRHTATKAGGTISSWSLGCLKDIKADEDWLGGRLTNWNHAFAIVNWLKGGNFTVEVVEIINGTASLWGKTING